MEIGPILFAHFTKRVEFSSPTNSLLLTKFLFVPTFVNFLNFLKSISLDLNIYSINRFAKFEICLKLTNNKFYGSKFCTSHKNT